jgi:hypothetical protein
MVRVFKGRFPTLGDLTAYHPIGEPGWIAKVGEIPHAFVGGVWVEDGGDGTEIVTGGLSVADKSEIAKVATLEAAFTKDGGELTPGETIAQGATRTYTIGEVVFSLENRQNGSRTVASPVDVAELNFWKVIGQYPAVSFAFPANTLIPKGYRLKRPDGALLLNDSTRVTPASLDITKWTIENPGNQEIDAWIKNAGDDHAAGEKLFKADDRRIDVAGVGVRITYRGADIESCSAMSIGEIANWEYVSQSGIPSAYPASALAPKGFLYQRDSQLLELKANTKLGANYDASQWVPRVETVRQVLTGQVFDLLEASKDGQPKVGICSGGNLSNGPSNAAQNVHGQWYYAGTLTDGRLVLSVVRANFTSIIGNWERVRSSGTWGEWTKINPSDIWVDTNDGGTCFTGSQYNWLDGHDVSIAYLNRADPIVIRPKTTWDKIGAIVDSGGAAVETLPTTGSDAIYLYFNLAKNRWEIRNPTGVETFQYFADAPLRGFDHRAMLMAGADAMTLPTGDRQAIITVSWIDGATPPIITAPGTERITGTKWDGTTFDDTSITLSAKGRTVTLIGLAAGGHLLTIGG